jgi:hypothetical protein
MIKFGIAAFVLCTAGICAAQSTEMAMQPAQTTPKHFRLTFVLTYPQGGQPSQSFVLDVPVMHDRSGMSSMSLAAGTTGQLAGSMQENLQCTDVHVSSTGLAAKIAFTMHSVSSEPLPDSTEPLHRQLTFERQVDLVLGKPTPITEQMHVFPLGKENNLLPNTPPAAPQITVTAVEM